MVVSEGAMQAADGCLRAYLPYAQALRHAKGSGEGSGSTRPVATQQTVTNLVRSGRKQR